MIILLRLLRRADPQYGEILGFSRGFEHGLNGSPVDALGIEDQSSPSGVVQAVCEANTVAWLLNKARFAPDFRESLRGADISVDEASLLDNQTMLGLVGLAREIDSRVIFQGEPWWAR